MVFFLADVQLATQDGLHTRFLGGVRELHRAKDVAVIGHGDRRHVEFLNALYELGGIASSVEHREIRVQMQMNKLLRHYVVGLCGSCLL